MKQTQRKTKVWVGVAFGLIVVLSSPLVFGADVAPLEKQSAEYVGTKKEIIVRFSAKADVGLKVAVRPLKVAVKIAPGSAGRVMYRFTNLTSEPARIQAIHDVQPASAEASFNKFVCFCFEKQILAPNETKDMAVAFTVAKTLSPEIDTIFLNYTVFRASPDNPAVSKSEGTHSDAKTF